MITFKNVGTKNPKILFNFKILFENKNPKHPAIKKIKYVNGLTPLVELSTYIL